MFEYLTTLFANLFVAVGPIENAVIFAGLTHHYTSKERRTIALRAIIIATVILVLFPLASGIILRVINLQLYTIEVGGGILLFILSIQIVMDNYESGHELSNKNTHKDLSVFPLAIPLIAGPATITQSIVFIGRAEGDILRQSFVIIAIILLMAFSYLMFTLAGMITKLIGEKGAEILSRALGILLSAIAIDFVISGLKASGLF